MTNGQLQRCACAANGGTYAVIDGLSFVPDSSAFNVVSSSPASGATVTGGITQMSVAFSHPVGATALNANSYTLNDTTGITISRSRRLTPPRSLWASRRIDAWFLQPGV